MKIFVFLFFIVTLSALAFATIGLDEVTTNELAISSGGNEHVRLTGSGVGIGTSTPEADLHVVGSANLQGQVGINGSLIEGVEAASVSSVPQSSWWHSNWLTRIKITFNNSGSSSNLVDFPVLVVLNGSNINYTKVQNSGQDLRFIDSDDSTLLYHEVEYWNESGKSYVWVKIPKIDASSTDDFIFLYFNNSNAVDVQNATQVWTNNYSGVWHMNNDPTGAGAVKGSTIYQINGTANGSMDATDLVNSEIGQGLILDGAGQTINFTSHSALDNHYNFTWTMALRPHKTVMDIVSKTASSGGGNHIETTSNNYITRVTHTGGSAQVTGSDLIRVNSSTQIVTASFDYTIRNLSLYVDGVHDGSSTGLGDKHLVPSADFIFGYALIASADSYDGLVDELRFSNVTRSDGWVHADYLSLTDRFNSYEPEQSLNWWNTSWKSRRQITFNNTNSSEDLINFTVLLHFNSSNLDYSKVENNGDDLRFIDSDGATTLPYEIMTYNESDQSYIWVKVRQIDATSTTDYIHMYYNNPGISSGSNTNTSWNSNYTGIWHLEGDPGGATPQVLDTTFNNHDGNTTGMNRNDLIPGYIGKAYAFDGTDDGVGIIDQTTIDADTGEFHWSGWIRSSDVAAGNPRVIDKRTGTNGVGYTLFYTPTSSNRLRLQIDEGSNQNTDTNLVSGTWHYFSFGRNSTHHYMFLDGIYQASTSDATLGDLTTTDNLTFGYRDDHSLYFNGDLDELRYATTSLSPDWIYAEYLSQSRQYATIGSEETFSDSNANQSALAISVNGTERMRLLADGRVGIGTTNPQEALSVVGNINASGTINANSGVDIAEKFSAIERMSPGDIVAAASGDDVMLARDVQANLAIGVVSSSPGLTLNKPGLTNPVLIALAGRVPVKVKGFVEAGDYITVSDTPGIGQAALKPGFAIGRALEDSSGGTVSILIEPGYFSPQVDQNSELIGGKQQRLIAQSAAVNIPSAAVEVPPIQTQTVPDEEEVVNKNQILQTPQGIKVILQ